MMSVDLVRYYQFLLMHFDRFRHEGVQGDLRTLIPIKDIRRRKRVKSVLEKALGFSANSAVRKDRMGSADSTASEGGAENAGGANSGPILEFGVYNGRTIRYMANMLPDTKLYGFDSFEGFPDDGRSDWQADFSVERMPDVPDNVTLIKGYFDESLPKFLYETPALPSPRLLHIDCDLYSSTKVVFDHVGPLLDAGNIIVFDELLHYGSFHSNEFLAFFEFLEKRGLSFRWLVKVGKLMPLEDLLNQKANHILPSMIDLRVLGYHQNVAIELTQRPKSYADDLAKYRSKAEDLAKLYPLE
ncbi:class I SAM-dependent methyltransferase [Kordiimonas sp. SCSIO 12610]|uniref:class I SAM-dependent methyltransferase n=1 Tax=Kordiimonas sp. SCSIO 12610 TaxID=2829597 RepID=UPI00210DB6E7|nr:class I SAM-dependent methyltransferase [Kordiimonas sp. SCSIO 12610]UTW56225.1 class I SAM-dependent methyltransferase [Kordiimonas sp. SCSIO 12610]